MGTMCNLLLVAIALLSLYHYGTFTEYHSEIEFDKIDLYNKDPMIVWEKWYKEAKILPANKLPETMSMGTTQSNSNPAARTLLMRGYDERGFQIYTDYTSPKSLELEGNNSTALVFLWCFVPEHAKDQTGFRQVRIEGVAEKLTKKENEKYFEKEPIDSKIRAAVQHQSERMTPKRREEMLQAARDLYNKVHDNPNFRIEMPEKWGGYIIRPFVFEFYQSTPNALATRIRFRKRNSKELEKLQRDLPDGVYAGAEDWVYEFLEF